MFLKQTNNYDCGPVAILNWLRVWAPELNLLSLRDTRRLLGTTRNGTSALDIYSLVLTLSPDASYLIGRQTLDQAFHYLSKSNPIMFAYTIGTPHIVTIVKQGRRFLITNFSKKEGHVLVTKRSLRAMVKKSTTPPIFILP